MPYLPVVLLVPCPLNVHSIHTSSPEAQALFNQGMMLAFGFNQPEAIKSFQEGLKHDADAAMLYFGIAYALGTEQSLCRAKHVLL